MDDDGREGGSRRGDGLVEERGSRGPHRARWEGMGESGWVGPFENTREGRSRWLGWVETDGRDEVFGGRPKTERRRERELGSRERRGGERSGSTLLRRRPFRSRASPCPPLPCPHLLSSISIDSRARKMRDGQGFFCASERVFHRWPRSLPSSPSKMLGERGWRLEERERGKGTDRRRRRGSPT